MYFQGMLENAVAYNVVALQAILNCWTGLYHNSFNLSNTKSGLANNKFNFKWLWFITNLLMGKCRALTLLEQI